MRALKVEFSVKRPVSAGLWAALILALVAFAVDQGWRAWVLQQRLHVLRAESAVLTQQIEQLAQARRDAAARAQAAPPYAQDAAAVAKIAGFPLDQVLASLESAQVLGVKVTELDVSAVDGMVRAELEFSDHPALLNYLEAINAGEPKPRWTLLQAQLGAASGGNWASITSSWSTRGQ